MGRPKHLGAFIFTSVWESPDWVSQSTIAWMQCSAVRRGQVIYLYSNLLCKYEQRKPPPLWLNVRAAPVAISLYQLHGARWEWEGIPPCYRTSLMSTSRLYWQGDLKIRQNFRRVCLSPFLIHFVSKCPLVFVTQYFKLLYTMNVCVCEQILCLTHLRVWELRDSSTNRQYKDRII